MAPRKRNLNKRQALSANAQAWLRRDRQNCSVFFMGKAQDELEALWREYGDTETTHWERGMRIPTAHSNEDA